jgi:vancomycin permeability regulator SanA
MIRNKKDVSLIIFAILIALLDLLFLYYVKYSNQHLTLSDFNLFNIGNIINLLSTFFLVLGLFIGLINGSLENKTKFIITIMVMQNLFFILAALLSNMKVAPSEYYIFNEPAEKIIDGLLYLLFQLFQFTLVSYVWLNIANKKKFVIIESFFNSVILFLIIMGFTFLFEWFTPIHENDTIKSNKGIAVVLGAAVWQNNLPSPSLRKRIDKALMLYKIGVVKKIQLTGGNAPGELSEAEVGYKYLLTKGMNPKDILLEERTSSTAEQISFIKKNLLKRNKNDIIIVSDAYHLPRVKEICKFNNINVRLIPSGLHIYNEINVKVRELVGLTFFWLFAV